jgi:hypothetical protein
MLAVGETKPNAAGGNTRKINFDFLEGIFGVTLQ